MLIPLPAYSVLLTHQAFVPGAIITELPGPVKPPVFTNLPQSYAFGKPAGGTVLKWMEEAFRFCVFLRNKNLLQYTHAGGSTP